MKWHFTTEPFGYALRDSKAIPQALLTKSAEGYFAAVIAPGFPSNGPFKSQITAGEHAEKMLRKIDMIKASDTVSEVPYKRGGK